MKRAPTLYLLGVTLLSMPATLVGQFAIDWSTIDDGGGASSSGVYTLNGTIGQADAGKLAGGRFELHGGFWPGVFATASATEPPTLVIQLSGANAIVSWFPNTEGFILEEADDFESPTWRPGPVGNPVTEPVVRQARFYRLRKP